MKMEKKSMVLKMFTQFEVENHTIKKIKILPSDNGGEYISSAMDAFFKTFGIVHQTTVPYKSQQNVVAERMNAAADEVLGGSSGYSSGAGRNKAIQKSGFIQSEGFSAFIP